MPERVSRFFGFPTRMGAKECSPLVVIMMERRTQSSRGSQPRKASLTTGTALHRLTGSMPTAQCSTCSRKDVSEVLVTIVHSSVKNHPTGRRSGPRTNAPDPETVRGVRISRDRWLGETPPGQAISWLRQGYLLPRDLPRVLPECYSASGDRG